MRQIDPGQLTNIAAAWKKSWSQLFLHRFKGFDLCSDHARPPTKAGCPIFAHVTWIGSTCSGYLQILDFYFFSDASLYCFGEHFSGPNWFTRLKRNVAILSVQDADGNGPPN